VLCWAQFLRTWPLRRVDTIPILSTAHWRSRPVYVNVAFDNIAILSKRQRPHPPWKITPPCLTICSYCQSDNVAVIVPLTICLYCQWHTRRQYVSLTIWLYCQGHTNARMTRSTSPADALRRVLAHSRSAQSRTRRLRANFG